VLPSVVEHARQLCSKYRETGKSFGNRLRVHLSTRRLVPALVRRDNHQATSAIDGQRDITSPLLGNHSELTEDGADAGTKPGRRSVGSTWARRPAPRNSDPSVQGLCCMVLERGGSVTADRTPCRGGPLLC
jgi:hypothetical protein